MGEPEQAADLRSFRSSCDRCRSQKLKCEPKKGMSKNRPHQACQRCCRAGLPCVFSRRSRNSTASERQEAAAATAAAAANNNSHTHSHSASPLHHQSDYAPPATHVPQHWGLVAGNASGADGNDFSFGPAPDSVTDASWEADFGDIFSGDLTWASCAQGLNLHDISEEGLFYNAHLPSNNDVTGATPTEDIVGLARLAGECGEYLRSIEHQGPPQPCIDTYPIGDVLHLSQQLISAMNSSSPSAKGSAPWLSLLSASYATLQRIYTKVFSDMHALLLSLPQVSAAGTTVMPGATVGNLTAVDQTEVKLYTAFKTALAMLRDCNVLMTPWSRCSRDYNAGSMALDPVHGWDDIKSAHSSDGHDSGESQAGLAGHHHLSTAADPADKCVCNSCINFTVPGKLTQKLDAKVGVLQAALRQRMGL